MFTILHTTKRFTITSFKVPKLYKAMCSKGALGGGFTQEGLEEYAKQLWNVQKEKQDDEQNNNNVGYPTTITDLSSQRISIECTQWLDSHDDASSKLANAYFGSLRFLPERLLMTPLFYFSNRHQTTEQRQQQQQVLNLPNKFQLNHEFLAWRVVAKTPLEIICSWEFGSYKGLTMMAFDPRLQKVYHGNSMYLNSQVLQTKGFALLNQFHLFYAKFLLVGMANKLEKDTVKFIDQREKKL